MFAWKFNDTRLVNQTKVNNFIFVFQLQKYILVHTYFFWIDILKFSKEMYIWHFYKINFLYHTADYIQIL
jgi:hypothetical protein